MDRAIGFLADNQELGTMGLAAYFAIVFILFLVILIATNKKDPLPKGMVYKINYLKAPGTYGQIIFLTLPFVMVYLFIKNPRPLNETIALISMVFSMFYTFALIGFYWLNIKIVLNEDGIYVKKMDKLEVVKWEDIKKVDRLLAVGAYQFRVRKKSRGFVEFWDYVDGYEDILDEIKKRTGIEVKWGRWMV